MLSNEEFIKALERINTLSKKELIDLALGYGEYVMNFCDPYNDAEDEDKPQTILEYMETNI